MPNYPFNHPFLPFPNHSFLYASSFLLLLILRPSGSGDITYFTIGTFYSTYGHTYPVGILLAPAFAHVALVVPV